MKKNILKILLVFIFFIIIGNIDVKAEESEYLTCIYGTSSKDMLEITNAQLGINATIYEGYPKSVILETNSKFTEYFKSEKKCPPTIYFALTASGSFNSADPYNNVLEYDLFLSEEDLDNVYESRNYNYRNQWNLKTTADPSEGVHVDPTPTIEDIPKIVERYYKYNSNTSIHITYKASTNQTFAMENGTKEIEIKNMSLFSEENIPDYIIKYQDSNEYYFIANKNELPDKDKKYDMYLSSKLLGSIQGLGEKLQLETCQDLFGDTFLTFMDNYIIKLIQIAVPIVLILLTSFDFAKVVMVDDKDGMQKAFKNLKNRVIVAVIIFLTPSIIILVANLTGAPDSVASCAKRIRAMSNQVNK